jgi:hypothetical protein
LGSVISSLAHRVVLATAVYILDFFQVVSAIAIVQPWRKSESLSTPATLSATSAALLALALVGFTAMKVLLSFFSLSCKLMLDATKTA